MRKKSCTLGVILIALVTLIALDAYALEVGSAAPDFSGTTLSGGKVSFTDGIKGKKAAYLIFWASWCPHCKTAFPSILKLYEKYKDKVDFIGVNVAVNENKKLVEKYIADNGLAFPNIFDTNNKITRTFRVMGTPSNIIIDQAGTITYLSSSVPEELDKYLSPNTSAKNP